MLRKESYRESHKTKGRDYHATFEDFPHRHMVWQFEKRLLLKIVYRNFKERKPKHLDFACGTGRILNHLAPHVLESTAVDVSGSMLAVAKKNVPGARFINGDLTRENLLLRDKFDLITAFRFFPNAEPELRREALVQLSYRLEKGGVLIFNNHINLGSFMHRLSSFRRGIKYTDGMIDEDIVSMTGAAGLKILARYPIAIGPFGENSMYLPRTIYGLEKFLSRVPGLTRFAQNIVYVCADDSR